MFEELLTEIGLTQSEIKVYFALLEIGSSTTGPIIKKSGIASGKAYLILDKLILKGLVTHVIRSGTKHYQAKDPERLLDYLKEKEHAIKEKEQRLKKIIPQLKATYEQEKYRPAAEVYEGDKGFKTFYDWILNELHKGDAIDIMGVPKEANKRYYSYILNWNKRRIQKGIKLRIIYNHNAREQAKERSKMKLTHVRYMKPQLETPAWIDIFKDYVATIHVHGTPACFVIRDKHSAESYKKYFDIIWKQSRGV